MDEDMITNRQIRPGELVRRDDDGATGEVIKGGFRPRVQWDANNRITRVDVRELTSTGVHKHACFEGECILCGALVEE